MLAFSVDVDLHVVDPEGFEIFYSRPASPLTAGAGVLDVDSNHDCELDGINTENIVYTRPLNGNYSVRVDMYKACGKLWCALCFAQLI